MAKLVLLVDEKTDGAGQAVSQCLSFLLQAALTNMGGSQTHPSSFRSWGNSISARFLPAMFLRLNIYMWLNWLGLDALNFSSREVC